MVGYAIRRCRTYLQLRLGDCLVGEPTVTPEPRRRQQRQPHVAERLRSTSTSEAQRSAQVVDNFLALLRVEGAGRLRVLPWRAIRLRILRSSARNDVRVKMRMHISEYGVVHAWCTRYFAYGSPDLPHITHERQELAIRRTLSTSDSVSSSVRLATVRGARLCESAQPSSVAS